MASNSFGEIFKITTWGESHGKAIGVVIDGCPAGIQISDEDINQELCIRSPGRNQLVSPRKEQDHAEIYSGTFEGITTGAPISILIMNQDADSTKYESIKHLLRPGHANFSYLSKYGIFDYRGGGRASARETACRVAAGAVAKKLLHFLEIKIFSYLYSVKDIQCPEFLITTENFSTLKKETQNSELFCPDQSTAIEMAKIIEITKNQGDSVGGIVAFYILGAPVGLGDPVYRKLEANLATAMMSLPATKSFEIGLGIDATKMFGSEHNDAFINSDKGITTKTNNAAGILGGITNGLPIYGKVGFKPTSSIQKPVDTVNINGEFDIFNLAEGSRHDPCVAIRAVPIVEAMCALVIADAILMNRSSKIK
jgi:chorismate synthase